VEWHCDSLCTIDMGRKCLRKVSVGMAPVGQKDGVYLDLQADVTGL